MILFNIILILHFVAFLWYTALLVMLYPKPVKQLPKTGLLLGISILVSGLLLVALKYPVINYYKVVPKLVIFGVISTLNGLYSRKTLPVKVYLVIVGLTVLASLIAVVKV
ncbi:MULTISPECIES: hypothetical protein [Niastella]|uniref:Integral membrane protein n=1 Tax=Niastella soli TaxID=2821487 RepID=A0ABS3YWE1_9BACT|nr:hypothetical protein [Niastella soli]MBO9202188.1 hypothetical protein [Niastella soli]